MAAAVSGFKFPVSSFDVTLRGVPANPTNHLSGPLYMVAAALMMAVVGVSVKWATHDLPTPVVVFFRNFFGLTALLPWLIKPGGITLRTERLRLHALRCAFGLCAMFTYFAALSALPLAQAVVLNFTSPLFIPFIARAWLGETLSRRILGGGGAGLRRAS
jgi:drug/metabolite transporter (DMT)-like permease